MPRNVAIVSDDVELREELSRAFAGTSEITLCSADQTAVEELQAAVPAAILFDLDLLAGDGFELLRRISADTTLCGVPVIALSSRSDLATREQAQRCDVAEFITKPPRASDLRTKVLALTKDGRKLSSGGRLRLGAMLVASGMLTTQQVDHALARQRETGRRLGELLVEEGTATEQGIIAAVASQARIDAVDLSLSPPQANAISLLPRDFIMRNRLMPLSIRDDGSLVLAMTNPLDVIAVDEVSMRIKRRVVPVICTQSGFDDTVAQYFSARGRLKSARDESVDATEPAPAVVDASAIDLVDEVLSDATGMGASDVHLEPRGDCLHVRCRIDGVLHELRELPKDTQQGVISRLKIMCNLDIAERRLPQDGRTSFELPDGRKVDLRLATLPSLYGENIAIRILEASYLPSTLASLGLAGDNLARFQSALDRPEGSIAIVGPTGSGKSTTPYTALERTGSAERKAYTVEDPVERRMEGIVQIEIRPAIGLTFARALRSIVRADPDVIMVGEIRDLETAMIAADASVTGHKVFSTLHTNDAAAAVTRLVEMGVPRYLVAAAWTCFVAQRLTRRLCMQCREPEEIGATRWREIGLGEAPQERLTVYNPVACARCFGTGYRGRLGLYEVLVVDDALRDIISNGGSALDIKRAARAKGEGSLRDDGVRRVLEGSTSYLELLRVTV